MKLTDRHFHFYLFVYRICNFTFCVLLLVLGWFSKTILKKNRKCFREIYIAIYFKNNTSKKANKIEKLSRLSAKRPFLLRLTVEALHLGSTNVVTVVLITHLYMRLLLTTSHQKNKYSSPNLEFQFISVN